MATPVGVFAAPVVAQETTENETATDTATDTPIEETNNTTETETETPTETETETPTETETDTPTETVTPTENETETPTENETETPVEEEEDNRTIDSCTVINESGTYTISENFSADELQEVSDPGVDANASACIVIAADNVTLDGQDIEISAPNGTTANQTNNESLTVGIAVAGDNATVQYPTVSDFDVGVHLAGTENASVNNLEARDTERAAVVFAGASDSVVENVTADNVSTSQLNETEINDTEINETEINDTEINETEINDTETNESNDTFSGAFAFVNSTNNTVREAVVNNTTGWTVSSQNTEALNNASNASQNASANVTQNNSVENVTVNETTFSATFRDVNIRPATDYPDAPEGVAVLGQPLQTEAMSENATFQLSFIYQESELEDAGTDEFSLSIYEVSGDSWSPVTGTHVNVSTNNATAMVDGNGTYALVGQTTNDTAENETAENDTVIVNDTAENETTENDTVIVNDTDENETIGMNDTVIVNDTDTDETNTELNETTANDTANDTVVINETTNDTANDTVIVNETTTNATATNNTTTNDTATPVGENTTTEASGNVTVET
ncbi:hypothetical protein [Halopelagius fulvigenes]|uniref:PGF-pre-PGF domain-containing protein n=1 Tax=Halopelagius fulvigenes TaxID=1198324 RepID=A0ABD5TYX6_9EURY